MKKRLLSIALVLVLALSLLPFGAAAARVNGPDAFALVKDYAVQNGVYSGDSYVYQCAEEKVDDMPGTFYLKYTPASDAVTLSCTFNKSVITFETTLVIPASLEMPYTARMNVTGLLTASQTAAVDSGFNTTTPLTITEQSSSMQIDSLEESFRYMLALMLTDVQDICFAGTRFSVGDLGFTALADEAGYAYDVPPLVSVHPESLSVKEGKRAVFSVTGSGEGLTYAWQYSTDGGATWKNSTAKRAASISFTAKASFNGRLYRCAVSDGSATVYSDSARITVSGLVITAQPKAVTASAGDKVSFSVAASGNGLTYAWQYSTDGGATWKNSTAQKAAHVLFTAKASFNGRLYRCVVTDADGNQAVSEPALLTVQ